MRLPLKLPFSKLENPHQLKCINFKKYSGFRNLELFKLEVFTNKKAFWLDIQLSPDLIRIRERQKAF